MGTASSIALRAEIIPPCPQPLERLRAAAAARAAAGVRRSLVPRDPDGDGLIDLASNDYLGLAGDKRLVAAAADAAGRWGAGSTGSRLVTGTTTLHARLEERLAGFGGAEARWCSPQGTWPTWPWSRRWPVPWVRRGRLPAGC